MQPVREQGLTDAFASGFGREAEVDEFRAAAVGRGVHEADAARDSPAARGQPEARLRAEAEVPVEDIGCPTHSREAGAVARVGIAFVEHARDLSAARGFERARVASREDGGIGERLDRPAGGYRRLLEDAGAGQVTLEIVERRHPVEAARLDRANQLAALRQELGFREMAQSIHKQHGSRRSNQAPRGRKRRGRSSPGSSAVQQLDLDLS